MNENMKSVLVKNKKLIIYPIVILLIIGVSIFTLIESFTPAKEKEINYRESSDVNYKVYLKKNNFYESDYLDNTNGNMLYVASLIDRINISFNYMFSTEENSTVEFEYKIIGDLIVSDDTGTKNYYKKSYVLLDTKNASINDNTNLSIKEEVDINYDYYNDIVNKFRSTYGLSVDSKLDVYMLVTKKNSENIELLDDKLLSSINFIIPLSEKAVNIKMDYKDLEETSYLIKLSNAVLGNKFLFITSIGLLVVALFVYVSWLKLFNSVVKKKTKYEKNIDRILKEYDRLVVETSTPPLLNNYNIVEVNDFPELIDVHDNLNVPIMYYNMEEEKMSYFYIIYQDTLYRHIIKETEVINDNMGNDLIGVNDELVDTKSNVLTEDNSLNDINNNISNDDISNNNYNGFELESNNKETEEFDSDHDEHHELESYVSNENVITEETKELDFNETDNIIDDDSSKFEEDNNDSNDYYSEEDSEEINNYFDDSNDENENLESNDNQNISTHKKRRRRRKKKNNSLINE